MFIYFWDRERQSMNGGGAEREGDTESEAGSRLWAISPEPNAGLELTDREIMTWAEVGRLTDWATQAPQFLLFFKNKTISNCSWLVYRNTVYFSIWILYLATLLNTFSSIILGQEDSVGFFPQILCHYD